MAIGAGPFYAYRLREALGIDPGYGVVRASMVHYTSEEEVDRLIRAPGAVIKRGFRPSGNGSRTMRA